MIVNIYMPARFNWLRPTCVLRPAVSIVVLAVLPLFSFSQTLKGKVTSGHDTPLYNANVHWINTTDGVLTNELGEFAIPDSSIPDRRLVVSYVGYTSDTVLVGDVRYVRIRLAEEKVLREVVIRGTREGIFIDEKNPIKTEVITQAELTKAACCDLTGCFDTQASVQPQTTNVLTNAKELRLLGLSGVYNQVLIDGFPLIQGLSYTYGISSIPGTLVDKINVSKGANSVLQGYESISGQINVETKEADNSDKLLLNGYVNNFLEKHINANYAVKKNSWSNLTALHTVQPASKFDRDDDTFLDLPLLTRYMLENKFKYGNDEAWGWSGRVAIRYLDEQRVGGQTFYNADTDKGTTNAYGQVVQLRQPEIWAKTSYRVNDRSRYVLFSSFLHQAQNSWFGTTRYRATQGSFYANAQVESAYGTANNLKAGISYRHFLLNENIDFTVNDLGRSYEGNYDKLEKIPGVFAENSLNLFSNKLMWLAGIRADYHSQFGWQITPRSLLKYQFNKNTNIRASVGTGWRTVNLFSENINLLISSRDVDIQEKLNPEKALNLGLNFSQQFTWGRHFGFLTFDFYHTTFQNQIFPDYDTDATRAIVKNFTGQSVSKGFQVETYLHLFNQVELKLAYNYLDVFRTINKAKTLLPFNPKDRILVTMSYKPESQKWHADLNLHYYGTQKLPDTAGNPAEFQRPEYSRSYSIVNFQLTKSWTKWELYAGIENMFDFRQKKPIIGWQNPFGQYFDTSGVWGPTRGREIYSGVRFKWLHKE